ncbi:S-adenosyl-L-methionine dependent methyltransferase [Lentinula detonsa]|uniref:S-adenosyl-L-methionine dependent methyltransferase n=1 Tax=Lentinula detonsa TaxID=2804962 RepID=A0A9W8NT81_9AGAR|nr:S-adenosyl-L-methionine dependent methyltransferase [Lentinula detonsa]
MHIRNVYRDGIDFTQLSTAYLPLRKYLIETSKSHKTIDFKDQAAQRCLTEALLHRDFNLKIRLLPDRLCPPVPNRLNYVLWLQDIISASRYVEEHDSKSIVHGIDVGTGASAIFPLLACTLEKSWKFMVSEIDPYSFENASHNISANKLDDRIQIVRSNATSPILLPLYIDEDRRFDFSMCNPPFYSSLQDVTQSAEAKENGPNAVCTGAEVEMITSGGESAFVGKMVIESLSIRERCRWYTSMLGKLSSAAEVIDILKSNSIDNYILTEFVQGQTRRWAVGWSYTDIRLPDSISRILNSNPTIAKYLPAHNTIQQPVLSVSRKSLYETVSSVLSSISHIQFYDDPHGRDTSDMEIDTEPRAGVGFLVFAQEDTWSRSARRRQKRLLGDSARPNLNLVSSVLAASAERVPSSRFACSIHIKESLVKKGAFVPAGNTVTKPNSPAVPTTQSFTVEFTWRQGRDRRLFDSFCSHVSGKVQ